MVMRSFSGVRRSAQSEKRQHGLVYIGDDASIDGHTQYQGGNALGHRAQIVRGRRIEIDDPRTIPRLQVKAPEVVLEGELAVTYDDDTVQIGFVPFLELRRQRAQLDTVEPDAFGRRHLPLILACDWVNEKHSCTKDRLDAERAVASGRRDGQHIMLFSTECSVAYRMLDLGHQHAITPGGKGGFPTSCPCLINGLRLAARYD
jgi:hypothetical protein